MAGFGSSLRPRCVHNGRSLTQEDATVGRRFGRDKRLGLVFGGSFDYDQRGINNTEAAPGTNDFKDGTDQNLRQILDRMVQTKEVWAAALTGASMPPILMPRRQIAPFGHACAPRQS